MLPTISTELLQARYLAGKHAATDLITFARITTPSVDEPLNVAASMYDPQPLHYLIAEAMQRVERRECRRLIITIPPSHGKSELAVHKFIPWVWGRNPRAKFIVATYAANLANDRGKEVRKVMLSPEYRLAFPDAGSQLSDGSKAMDWLATNAGGKAYFVGLNGGVTGKHADYFIIDDPIKGSEEARSQTVRDKIWQNIIEVCFTRRMDTSSPIVMIMTRWNPDDPAGRFTDPKNPFCNAEQIGDWEVLHLRGCVMTQQQAEDDPLHREVGEALWPKKMSAEDYQKMARADDITRQAFLTLYQGDPAPESGTFFRSDWLAPYGSENELPKQLRKYVGSDHAVRAEQVNDQTCIIPAGVDSGGDLWILPDVWWFRKTTDLVVDAMIEKIRQHHPLGWFAGRDHITGAIGPFLNTRMREENAYCAMFQLSDTRDKESKAQPIQGRMAQKRVHFPVFAPWWPAAREQLMNFPKGGEDDFVDALANIGRGMAQHIKAEEMRPDNSIIKGSWAWHTRGQDKAPSVKGWV